MITVAAPISGKVLEINVVEGEFRNETHDAAHDHRGSSRVWATSDVPESKMRYCKMGGTALLWHSSPFPMRRSERA